MPTPVPATFRAFVGTRKEDLLRLRVGLPLRCCAPQVAWSQRTRIADIPVEPLLTVHRRGGAGPAVGRSDPRVGRE
eukprot:7245059-Prymnesium_polylepis.1